MLRPSQPSPRWLALLAATIIVLYLCWLMILPMIDVLLWGVVLAMIAWPVQAYFRRRGFSPPVSAALTTCLVVLTVLIPATFITAAIVKQVDNNLPDIQISLHKLLDSSLFKWLDRQFDLGQFRDSKVLSEKINSALRALASRTLGILGIIGGALGAIVQMFFVLFTLYYLLRDSQNIIPALRRSLPLSEDNADVIFKRTGEVISASVNGVLVISAIQGFLGMVAFMVLGLSPALLWGVMMFLFSTIPMAGAFIVWVPGAIYLAATDHWIKAVILTVWGAGVIGMIDNVLRPKLVGKRAKLHELIIFFSVIGGLQVFGVLGLFVGPVVAAIALALVDIWSGDRNDNMEVKSEKLENDGKAVVIDPAPVQVPVPLPVPHKTGDSD